MPAGQRFQSPRESSPATAQRGDTPSERWTACWENKDSSESRTENNIFEMTTNGTHYLSTNTGGGGHAAPGPGRLLRRKRPTSFRGAGPSVPAASRPSAPSGTCLRESERHLAFEERGAFFLRLLMHLILSRIGGNLCSLQEPPNHQDPKHVQVENRSLRHTGLRHSPSFLGISSKDPLPHGPKHWGYCIPPSLCVCRGRGAFYRIMGLVFREPSARLQWLSAGLWKNQVCRAACGC